MIFIRTDANEIIASGHLMRTLTIARACREREIEVCFLFSDRRSYDFMLHQLFLGESYDVIILSELDCRVNDDYLQKELPVLDRLIQEKKPGGILIDSYFVTHEYLSRLGKWVRTAYIDDRMEEDYQVDLLINYDRVDGDNADAYRDAYKKAKQQLLGFSYCPLRKQFIDVEYRVRDKVENILILTGGADIYGTADRLLKEWFTTDILQENPGKYHFHVVVGNLRTDVEFLIKMAESGKRITLHRNVTEMAKLMSSCDLAISAAGTTLYELCAVGVPSISYIVADNQLSCAESFAKKDTIICTGDIRSRENIYKIIIDDAEKLAGDYRKRIELSREMRREIDAKGADRIAEVLNTWE